MRNQSVGSEGVHFTRCFVNDVLAEVLVQVMLSDGPNTSLEKHRRGPPTFLTARAGEGEAATATGYEEVHQTRCIPIRAGHTGSHDAPHHSPRPRPRAVSEEERTPTTSAAWISVYCP